MFVLSALKIGVFISIISRLFYLQISENIKYRSLSDKNRFREWRLAPQRGVIEDYFGKKIADNTQTFQLHMIPEDVPNLESLLFRLSRIIDFSQQRRSRLMKRLKRRKPWETIIISDNLSCLGATGLPADPDCQISFHRVFSPGIQCISHDYRCRPC